jgi:hypothetical protein
MTPTGGSKMNRATWLTIALLGLGLALAGCGDQIASAAESPSRLEPVQGSNVQRVILTPDAVRRIGLQTAPVQQVPGAANTVPLAAVIYLKDGTTWVYTVAGTRTYVRQQVTIAQAAGDTATLKTGPTPGTTVVTTGAAELLGSEYGVAGGQ